MSFYTSIALHTESRLASIAERVASGELADVSMDICSAGSVVKVKGSHSGGVKRTKKATGVKKTAPEGKLKDASSLTDKKKKQDLSRAPVKAAVDEGTYTHKYM